MAREGPGTKRYLGALAFGLHVSGTALAAGRTPSERRLRSARPPSMRYRGLAPFRSQVHASVKGQCERESVPIPFGASAIAPFATATHYNRTSPYSPIGTHLSINFRRGPMRGTAG
jgi:hypothetical protein